MKEPTINQMTESPHETQGQGAESVVRMLRYLFAALRILIVVVIFLVFVQGIFTVREQEQAMLFRFGRLIAKDGREVLGSGWYWAWPYPIDEVKKIPAERPIVLETTHYWSAGNIAELRGEEQASPEEGPGLAPGQDGYLLTGDANIIHMTWKVTYRITDPPKYYLDFYEGTSEERQLEQDENVTSEAAEALVRNCLENSILKETAGWSVDDIMKRSRAEVMPEAGSTGSERAGARSYLSNAVQNRVEKMVAKMEVGVEIENATLTNVQPPRGTIQAFKRVNDAIQERDATLKEAQTYQNRVVNEAESSRAKVLAQARAYAQRVRASVEADKDYFLKVLDEYKDNPDTMLVSIYADTIRDVLKKVEERYVIHTREDGQQEIRLMITREPKRNKPQGDEESY